MLAGRSRLAIPSFLLALLCGSAAPEAATAPDGAAQWISGPYSHENLAVYLVHAQNAAEPVRPLLTLSEALAAGKAVVHETGDVNQLAIENRSTEEDIYVQAGDIVKGGQQDRVLSVDLVLPPGSGVVPIDAFCVEHGRWTARGSESVARFDSSEAALAFKDLKLAARYAESQQEVWAQVAAAQEKLSLAADASVASPASPTSLQLSLENERVQGLTEAYVGALEPLAASHPDAVGFIFAVNGRINGGEIYASSTLFRKLWPKLLKAGAVEALAERGGDSAPALPTLESIEAFLAAPQSGPEATEQVTERISLATRETEGAVLFETRDAAQAAAWLHRSYIAK